MIFKDQDKIRSAWREAVHRSGASIVVNGQLARAELRKAYGNPTASDLADIENLVTALEAGAFQLLESASSRDNAALELSSRLRLGESHGRELASVLAPAGLRERDPAPKPVTNTVKVRRRVLGLRPRTWAAGVALLGVLGSASYLAVKRDGDRADQIAQLKDEVTRLSQRESQLKDKEKALAAAQATVKDLEAKIGKPADDGAKATGLTGELAAAVDQVEQLTLDLEFTKSQIPAETIPPLPTVLEQGAPLKIRAAQFSGVFDPKGNCDGSNGCSSPAQFTREVQISNTAEGPSQISISVPGMFSATLNATLGGAWAGDAVLESGFGATCNGLPMASPLSAIMFNQGFTADPSQQTIELSGFNLLVSETTPTCNGARFSYLAKIDVVNR